MNALNAVGLTPLSVLAKRTEPRKNLSVAIISQLKNQTFSNSVAVSSVSKTLALLPSVLNSGLAKALTYEEALQQSGGGSSSDIDVNGVLDSVIDFTAKNPLIVGGGAAVLAVTLVISQLLSKPKPWGVESAKNAYAKLGGDANAQLLDIRSPAEIRQIGSPDVTGLKKKAVAVVYKGADKPGFLNKLALKFKEPENTTLFVLDKFDGNSELVAELVTANGFKAAYAIKGGAEGSRGWKNSGLPWTLPKMAFNLDFSNLTESLGEAFDLGPLTLGVAAAAGLGLLAFTEVETILQFLGSAAIIQFVSKKLLFAEDRKQTIQQIEELLNTKVTAKELVGDIQQIGKVLLSSPVTSKALPASAEVTPIAPSDNSVQKSESIPPKVEAASEVNFVPKAEVQQESLPQLSRPLSPYPNYPDYKPPSSPIPSQP
ncbi:hypothetical protein CDL12_13489 [Handroanthus impetiginosus]|uniref:Rhodanese domain-containing protein n=1 Tax=Handroanthus impetiginosus TaxID=429701 RepID=A0A2G9H8Q0_9LAMI|nr:hypothetical protein CDL12_13489 [Handroanthus impetiginosus]